MTLQATNRWKMTVSVTSGDKIRLRKFIANEIAYYNSILESLSSRMRTMPEVFSELPDEFVGAIAAHGYNVRALTKEILPEELIPYVHFFENGLTLTEQQILFLESLSVACVLHPETRRAMTLEMIKNHRSQAEALSRASLKEDHVLRAAVELLAPQDARSKRHVQLTKEAVKIIGDKLYLPYAKQPIILAGSIPEAWNLLIIRDMDHPGDNGPWNLEFCKDDANYLLKAADRFHDRSKVRNHSYRVSATPR